MEAWAGRPKELLTYDFQRDRRSTPQGNEGYAEYAARLDRPRCYKQWTLLVYMAADNDLSPYAYRNLYEMEADLPNGEQALGSTLSTDLLVQLDTPGRTGIRRLHMFQSPRPFNARLTKEDFAKWKESDVYSPIVELLPEPETADPAADFQQFLSWGVRQYPAEHYLVILWGHGQGWAPAEAPKNPARSRFLRREEIALPLPVPGPSENPFAARGFRGGIGFDWTQRSYLDIPSLHRALQAVVKDTLAGRPFDVYASDACLMQMVEVATEVSDVTRFIVGSTQVQDFVGLPYRELLYRLNTRRWGGIERRVQTDDVAYLAAHLIPDLYQALLHGDERSPTAWLSMEAAKTATMSALSTSELSAQLLPALARFGDAMVAYLKEDPSPPLRKDEIIYVLRDTPGFLGGAQDLGAFLTSIKLLVKRASSETGQQTPASQELLLAIDSAHDALRRTVLNYAYGTDYRSLESQLHLLGFKAFSAWLPVSQKDYASRIQDFSSSTFYRYGAPSPTASGPWKRWLELLYERRGPSITAAQPALRLPFPKIRKPTGSSP